MYVSGPTLSSHCGCRGLASPHAPRAPEQLFFPLHKASLEPFFRVTASYIIKDIKVSQDRPRRSLDSHTQTSLGTAESVVHRAAGLSSGLQQTGQGEERASQHSTLRPEGRALLPSLRLH